MFILQAMKAAVVGLCTAALCIQSPVGPDTLRNVKPGEPVPEFRLENAVGNPIDSDAYKGKVLVLVYVVAGQLSSERAIVDADQVVKNLAGRPIELLFVTAYADRKPYFEQFWNKKSIKAPLAFDANRKLYSDLGLIAFPTTTVINRDGRLVHALSTRGNDYRHILDGFARHALGLLDDAALEEFLQTPEQLKTTPLDRASRHRAVARLLREKGLYSGAEKELGQALKADPENIDVLLDLADLQLRVNKVDDAKRNVEQVLKMNARHRRANLLRGIVLFRLGHLDDAKVVLTEALVLNPDPARTHFYLGRIAEANGAKDTAIGHYRQALSRLLDEPNDQPKPEPAQTDDET
jgi:tetratricopeptide (TPR) repeat protein